MNKIFLMVAVVLFLAVGVAMASVSIVTVNHQSVLSGTISSIGIVHEGQVVKEGQVLVNVQTLVGTAPTSRAQLDGTVVKVLVVPGQKVSAGDIIVIIAKK